MGVPWQQRSGTYGMLHNYVVAFIFVRHAKVIEEGIGRLTHDHGAEELTTKPGSTARRDTCLDDGDFEVGTLLRKLVSSAQTARAGTNDDDVGLGIGVEVGKVATS